MNFVFVRVDLLIASSSHRSALEHIAKQLLHRRVPNGSMKVDVADALGAHEAQCDQKQ